LNRFSRDARDDRAEILDQPLSSEVFWDVSLLIQKMGYVGDPHIQLDSLNNNFFHDALEPANFFSPKRPKKVL